MFVLLDARHAVRSRRLGAHGAGIEGLSWDERRSGLSAVRNLDVKPCECVRCSMCVDIIGRLSFFQGCQSYCIMDFER